MLNLLYIHKGDWILQTNWLLSEQNPFSIRSFLHCVGMQHQPNILHLTLFLLLDPQQLIPKIPFLLLLLLSPPPLSLLLFITHHKSQGPTLLQWLSEREALVVLVHGHAMKRGGKRGEVWVWWARRERGASGWVVWMVGGWWWGWGWEHLRELLS